MLYVDLVLYVSNDGFDDDCKYKAHIKVKVL